ncbi:MAG: hypothetical protein R2824_32375 [Saprospiraceae bacterium]|nr:hypothetical protein [Lewinella sp.]
MIYRQLIPALLLLLLIPALTEGQSGWTRNKGGWYAQAEAMSFSSNNYYSTEGMRNEGNTFFSYGLKTYAEYGWSDRLTSIFNWPLLKMQHFSGTGTAVGLGDVQLGVKYALSKKWPVAIGLAVDIPTDDGKLFAQAKEENDLGIRERVNLPTSDGEFNFRANLAVSQSFNGGHSYASLYGGVNLRTQGYSHQWQSGIELGQLLFDRLWVIGKLNQQGRFSDEVNRSVSFLYGEGTTYSAYNVSLLYKVTDHFLITAAYQDFTDFLIAKRNLYDGGTVSVGVAFEY